MVPVHPDNKLTHALADPSTRLPGSLSHVISAGYWDTMVVFARATGLKLLFDFNCFQFRTETGAWDPSNAEQVRGQCLLALIRHADGWCAV